MSGFYTNGLPVAVSPLTGNELIAADTALTQGLSPESEALSMTVISQYCNTGGLGGSAVATADGGSTASLTAAMIYVLGSKFVAHVSSGGTTPTLTLPTVAAMVAAFPTVQGGVSWTLRVINSNSGTATIATAAGWTTTGTLTIATNTTRDFVVTLGTASATIAATTTATIVSVGTGTNS